MSDPQDLDILGRLIADEHLRNTLFKDPEGTLRGLGIHDESKLKEARALFESVKQKGAEDSLEHLKTLHAVSQ